jgi:hypothetical protein
MTLGELGHAGEPDCRPRAAFSSVESGVLTIPAKSGG